MDWGGRVSFPRRPWRTSQIPRASQSLPSPISHFCPCVLCYTHDDCDSFPYCGFVPSTPSHLAHLPHSSLSFDFSPSVQHPAPFESTRITSISWSIFHSTPHITTVVVFLFSPASFVIVIVVLCIIVINTVHTAVILTDIKRAMVHNSTPKSHAFPLRVNQLSCYGVV